MAAETVRQGREQLARIAERHGDAAASDHRVASVVWDADGAQRVASQRLTDYDDAVQAAREAYYRRRR